MVLAAFGAAVLHSSLACCCCPDFAYDLVPYLADQTSTRLSVSLTSGLVAGVCAAIVSQPGETQEFIETALG